MLAALLLIGLGLLVDEPPVSKPPTITPEERKIFDSQRLDAAKDPARLIKLAMWAESKGLGKEREELLKDATVLDPKSEAAWGLLGLVSYQGAYKSPEEVAKRSIDEVSQAAKYAEYSDRRDQLNRAEENERNLVGNLEGQGKILEARMVQWRIDHRLAPAHVKLGLWCESNGMKPEAEAHFTSALLLDASLESAWKHLGYLKHNGRWMTHDQIAAETKEIAEQHAADRQWGPLLHRWKTWLNQEALRASAEKNLAEVNDPRALPSIIKTFVTASPKDQAEAVRLLGVIRTPNSSTELAFLAVQSDYEPVRDQAIDVLKGRDLRDYGEALVNMIHNSWIYRFVPVQGPGTKGMLEVDSPRFHLTRTYDAPVAFRLGSSFYGYAGIDPNGLPIVMQGRDLTNYNRESQAKKVADLVIAEEKTASMIASANFKAESSRQQMIADINDIEVHNANSAMLYAQIAPVLQRAAGAPANLENDEDAWNTWYYEKTGYRYTPPPKITLQQSFSQIPTPRIVSCFAAGTPVRTIKGVRPIETIETGDRVLCQDPKLGGLSFQPVLVVHRNPPDKTLEIALDNGDFLVASRFHRFWLAGQGWAMARDLKVGDVVRTLGGRSAVKRIGDGPFVPVFNLDVAGGRTFFVGDHDALVHDNTPPGSLVTPFDVKADLAGLIPLKP